MVYLIQWCSGFFSGGRWWYTITINYTFNVKIKVFYMFSACISTCNKQYGNWLDYENKVETKETCFSFPCKLWSKQCIRLEDKMWMSKASQNILHFRWKKYPVCSIYTANVLITAQYQPVSCKCGCVRAESGAAGFKVSDGCKRFHKTFSCSKLLIKTTAQ